MIESSWEQMKKKEDIYATPEEWQAAKSVMRDLLASGKKPPFKIPKNKDQGLSHSFLVGIDENEQPIIGVVARYKTADNELFSEGIIGHGEFGVCKLVKWEDNQYNAFKVEPNNPDAAEIAIMNKLGLIRFAFKRTFEERTSDKLLSSGDSPKTRWIKDKPIEEKKYKVINYIEGINLKNFLSTAPTPSINDSYQMIKSLTKSLEKIHAKNIIHNDIHDENVLVGIDNRVYFVDYGRSCDLSNLPQKISGEDAIIDIVNRYMPRVDVWAPEVMKFHNFFEQSVNQLHTKQEYDDLFNEEYELPLTKSSDIYSLGLLIEKLCPLQLKNDLNNPLMKLVKQMKNIDPSKRPNAGEVFKKLKSKEIKSFIREAKIKDDEVKKQRQRAQVPPVAATVGAAKPSTQANRYSTMVGTSPLENHSASDYANPLNIKRPMNFSDTETSEQQSHDIEFSEDEQSAMEEPKEIEFSENEPEETKEIEFSENEPEETKEIEFSENEPEEQHMPEIEFSENEPEQSEGEKNEKYALSNEERSDPDAELQWNADGSSEQSSSDEDLIQEYTDITNESSETSSTDSEPDEKERRPNPFSPRYQQYNAQQYNEKTSRSDEEKVQSPTKRKKMD
ncbi:MAG: protein kinase [Proteobacteria bacterium]|nr:protein kinase [Pseudomonadota bacterium]